MFSQFCSLVIIRPHYVLFGALSTPWKSHYALLGALGPPSYCPVILLIGLMISDLLPYPVSRGLPTPGPIGYKGHKYPALSPSACRYNNKVIIFIPLWSCASLLWRA